MLAHSTVRLCDDELIAQSQRPSLQSGKKTYLKVSQNHLSVHVATTVGGHCSEWLTLASCSTVPLQLCSALLAHFFGPSALAHTRSETQRVNRDCKKISAFNFNPHMTPELIFLQQRTREQNPHLSSHFLICSCCFFLFFFFQQIFYYSHFLIQATETTYGSREDCRKTNQGPRQRCWINPESTRKC